MRYKFDGAILQIFKLITKFIDKLAMSAVSV